MSNCFLIGDFANRFQESVIFPCVRHFTCSVRATRLLSYQLTRMNSWSRETINVRFNLRLPSSIICKQRGNIKVLINVFFNVFFLFILFSFCYLFAFCILKIYGAVLLCPSEQVNHFIFFFLSKEKKYWQILNQIDSIAFIILKIILPRAAQKRTDQQQFRG